MSGWNLKCGIIKELVLSEDEIWSKFNFVFSDSSKKRNTYKFGLLKSIFDNTFNMISTEMGMFLSYDKIFSKFTENYWNLVVKYDLKQMRPDGKSQFSKIETILKNIVNDNNALISVDYNSIDKDTQNKILKKVITECKKNVIGALYDDFDGTIYSFDLKGSGVYINKCIYSFIQKHKMELEKLNYYSWAKFLEKVNDESALIRVIDKLELSTPKRDNLSVYRELLYKEFEEHNCFYCGKKLLRKIHVDHFIPWSFIKEDKIWNFVLACPTCNIKKTNKLANFKYIDIIECRNKYINNYNNRIIKMDFEGYYDGLLKRLWYYARYSGIKEFHQK